MTTRTTRRSFITAAGAGLALPAIGSGRATAQGRSISVGTYNGPMAEFIRRQVIPKFEADLGCKVFLTEGFTLANVALLRQQKARPTYSVMMMDDAGIPIAKAESLIETLDPARIPNLRNALPRYIVNDNFGVAFSVSICSPFINSASFQPVKSYAELWDKKFRGRLLMVSPKQGTSIMVLIAAAAVASGKPLKEAQYLIDKGFDAMAELKPNIMTIYDNNVTAILQVAQGEADAGVVEFSKYIAPYTVKGATVEQCYPKEGVFGGINCMTLVKNAPDRELGEAFISRMLDPVVQKGLAEEVYAAPTVRDVTLDPKIAPRVAYPEKRIDELDLCMIDWGFINPKRGEIVEKLNRILGA
ncbi:extracellular solute-binding protein [Enterovirga rhinocerotis]|uniref:Putative spermidine/putrescine transport system substrate-binding protein n=1 Tax=Enterovirga rhinocerotis TaxID=1339210 RepID=A0A4R7C3H4_9HYPH|nr:extracellular solute-binding protein [Enterovirga rhinocerotis]TDR92958.1 putative spermidine/putrescine transport system substrate-binding protein [Enterovirga rhinocerotis]